MKTSEAIDKISEALSLAQAEFEPVVKNKTNPHFKNKYADLSAVFEATRPALTKYGLALLQFPEVKEGRAGVVTRLVHKSGQWFEGDLYLKPQSDTPQHAGSAVTYARRYSAQAILGVDAEEDDDGEEASRKAPIPPPPPRVMQKTPKIFNSEDSTQVTWLDSFLKSKGIEQEHFPNIARYLNGKDLNSELMKVVTEFQNE